MIEKKSLRIFGFMWASILGFVGYTSGNNSVFLSISLCFIASSIFYPQIYAQTRIFQIWIKIGNFIGHINSKIIIFILFFFIFTPIGILLKIFKKDLLKKKLDKNLVSYFEKRQTQPGTMVDQF